MAVSIASIATQTPERLIKRLCKHWGHKFPVDLQEQSGTVELPTGRCSMRAGEGTLLVELEGEQEHLPRLQEVVADHLQRMASEESLAIDWRS